VSVNDKIETLQRSLYLNESQYSENDLQNIGQFLDRAIEAADLHGSSDSYVRCRQAGYNHDSCKDQGPGYVKCRQAGYNHSQCDGQ
jgi:hypothetical protein